VEGEEISDQEDTWEVDLEDKEEIALWQIWWSDCQYHGGKLYTGSQISTWWSSAARTEKCLMALTTPGPDTGDWWPHTSRDHTTPGPHTGAFELLVGTASFCPKMGVFAPYLDCEQDVNVQAPHNFSHNPVNCFLHWWCAT
jgi:hypothetical protein